MASSLPTSEIAWDHGILGYVVSRRLLTHCLHCILGSVGFNVKKAEPDQKVLQSELSRFCLKSRKKKKKKKSTMHGLSQILVFVPNSSFATDYLFLFLEKVLQLIGLVSLFHKKLA